MAMILNRTHGITYLRATDDKQRAVVLDFLCHSSYANTARAFSQECTVRSANVDADGDEIMSGDGKDQLVGGEDAGLILSEDTLKQIELRKGVSYILNTMSPLLWLYIA